MSGFAADYPAAEVRVSPNFGKRRDGKVPDTIVLHYTGMESGDAAERWLCNPDSEVSSHYLVHEDGHVVQMVREEARAWHAGKGSWNGAADVNSFSIGIEIANCGHGFGYPDFPARQIEAVIELCRDIGGRRGIRPERVLGHSDVAPGRKIDPGEKFPWRELAEKSVGLYVEPAPLADGTVLDVGVKGERVEKLQSMLAYYGYGVEITSFYDSQTEAVVAAFQRHFRPARIDGIADQSTRDTLLQLLALLPTGSGAS